MDFKLEKEKVDDLPYSAVQELIQAKKLFAELIERAIDERMQIIEGSDNNIFTAVDKENDYYFMLNSVTYNTPEKRVIYSITKKPQSREILGRSSHNLIFTKIEEVFQGWLTEVSALRAVKHEFYFPDRKFDDDQFREYFINDDEDAAYNPFEIDRQQVIFEFLKYAEKTIEQDQAIDQEAKQILLEQAAGLKEGVAKLTKKRFVAALSKFAQSTKSVSNSLFNTVFDLLKKEAIKDVLFNRGARIANAIEEIHKGIIHLLP